MRTVNDNFVGAKLAVLLVFYLKNHWKLHSILRLKLRVEGGIMDKETALSFIIMSWAALLAVYLVSSDSEASTVMTHFL